MLLTHPFHPLCKMMQKDGYTYTAGKWVKLVCRYHNNKMLECKILNELFPVDRKSSALMANSKTREGYLPPSNY